MYSILIAVILHVSEDDIVDPSPDLRDNINKRRKMDQELVETKEALKRVTDEMERMRNDNDKMRNEMDELRNLGARGIPVQFALGFRPHEYLALSYVKSAEWVAGPLTTCMKALMKKHSLYFEAYVMLGGIDSMGVRTCAKYNRGEYCPTKWHKNEKPIRAMEGHQAGPARTRSELRLHCCVLCVEAIGVIVGHPLMNCPWIQTSTWQKIFGTQNASDTSMVTLD